MLLQYPDSIFHDSTPPWWLLFTPAHPTRGLLCIQFKALSKQRSDMLFSELKVKTHAASISNASSSMCSDDHISVNKSFTLQKWKCFESQVIYMIRTNSDCSQKARHRQLFFDLKRFYLYGQTPAKRLRVEPCWLGNGCLSEMSPL